MHRQTSQKRVDELAQIIYDWISEADDIDIRDMIAMLDMVKFEIMWDKVAQIREAENGTEESR